MLHSCLSDALTTLGFVCYMGGCDIWMCNEGDYYFYVDLLYDDLIVVHTYPDNVFDSIRGNSVNIKETSDPEYFLGGDFECVKEPKTENEILT